VIEFTRQFKFSENLEDSVMENVAGEQGLAIQRLFPCKSSYSLKNSDCHKFSCFNDGDFKLGHFAIILQVIAHNIKTF